MTTPAPQRRRLAGARVAAAVLALLVILAAGAGALEALLGVSHDVPDLALARCAPGWPHVLGCDAIGDDTLARLLFGGRISLAVGLCAALLSTIAGTIIGLCAGAAGGAVDFAIMRFVDAMLAIPVLPLLILLSALTHGSTAKLVLLLAAFGFMGVARIARAEAIRISALDYAVAARALGASRLRILARHVLPNAAPPILVAATLDVGRNILAEAALSFLGLGVQPPTPSWGNMLRHAEDTLANDPASAFWPGSCILLAVACIQALGTALSRSLDPRGGHSAKGAPS